MIKKTDQEVMRENNTKLVLKTLFDTDQTSRSLIADKINLQKSTVSSIVRELHEQGLIEELGIGEASNIGGRRPNLIRFNRKYGLVLAFDMGVKHLKYSVNYINGELIHQDSIKIYTNKVKDIFALMKDIILNLNHHNTLNGLIGIAIAVHAPVSNNLVLYSPFLDFETFDLIEALKELIDVPVVIENEANLTAIYIRDFYQHAHQVQFDNILAINIHNGIGVGTIIDRRLYKGLNGLSGEIGRSIIMTGNKEYRRLEEIYSEKAVLDRIAQLKNKPNFTLEDFVSLMENKDPEVTSIMEQWVTAIAQITYNSIQYSAPDAVFLSSRFIAHFPSLLDRINEEYVALEPLGPTQIISLDDHIHELTLLGGVSLVARQILGLESYDLSFTK
ncbi:ROK family transcriptional regulator [Paenibacillus physcomitrellae]|uniref:Transcriptional regulator n=1 Tax=Paenibacillus physcomitrellae TaxID=1619311 RepID=A0ABQ1GLA7_9BACL|nr:ROK family transcriptional regulator [Paenibacillus physcomitrellae]GGA46079.1 transcriptional regulator [Paenibacillus physcomitrellae]